ILIYRVIIPGPLITHTRFPDGLMGNVISHCQKLYGMILLLLFQGQSFLLSLFFCSPFLSPSRKIHSHGNTDDQHDDQGCQSTCPCYHSFSQFFFSLEPPLFSSFLPLPVSPEKLFSFVHSFSPS